MRAKVGFILTASAFILHLNDTDLACPESSDRSASFSLKISAITVHVLAGQGAQGAYGAAYAALIRIDTERSRMRKR